MILAAASAAPGLYIAINYDQLMMRMQGVDELTTAQLILGTMLIVLLLKHLAHRRAALVIVALVFTVYTYVCDAVFFPLYLEECPQNSTELSRVCSNR